MLKLPTPLCGHSNQELIVKNHTAQCVVCNSFWDLNALASTTVYNGEYADTRAHTNTGIGVLKVKTLKNWIRLSNLNTANLNICEIGFGGAHCLSYLQKNSASAIGIEASEDHIKQAIHLGVPKNHLYLFQQLPENLNPKIDLWIFQDSFEHLPNPTTFMNWVNDQSTENCAILIVAPLAGSISEKLLGRMWPHRLSDHQFHWSEKGLYEFFANQNYKVEKRFYPLKHVSLNTIINHLAHKFGFKSVNLQSSLSFKFNIGEIGLLLRKTKNQ